MNEYLGFSRPPPLKSKIAIKVSLGSFEHVTVELSYFSTEPPPPSLQETAEHPLPFQTHIWRRSPSTHVFLLIFFLKPEGQF